MITVRRIFAAASLALCMTAFNACVKEEAPEQLPVTDDNLVEVTFEAPSVGAKSTFDGDARRINWEMTDKVAIYDGTEKRQFSVTNIEDGVATLRGSVAADATEFYAVYPYSAAGEDLPVEGVINITVPQEQTLAAGKNFDEDAFVTVGKVEDGSIAFKNVVSLLKLYIPADVTSVKLISYSTEMFAGAARAETDRTTTEGNATSVVLKPSAATFTAGEHYIALLPTTFEKGFRVIYEQASQLGVLKTTSEVEFPVNGGLSITGSTPSWIPTVIMTETQLRNYFANQDLFGTTEVKIGQDIALTSAWTPVALTGKLDGQEHTISEVEVSGTYNVGFFKTVGSGASVKNLTIEGTIHAEAAPEGIRNFVGVAGQVNGGTMTNVINKATITTAAEGTRSLQVGGIAGALTAGGSLIGCENRAAVTANGSGDAICVVGGIVGYIGTTGNDTNEKGGTVSGCKNYGTVTSNNDKVEGIGGIAGMFRGGLIDGCINEESGVVTANKTATGHVGGCIGYIQNRSGAVAKVNACENKGSVQSNTTSVSGVGGIVGHLHMWQNANTEITGCYNKKAITVTTIVANGFLSGIVGKMSSSGSYSAIIRDCHNEADVVFNCSSLTAGKLGGIAGFTTSNVVIESCDNSAKCTIIGSKSEGNTSHVGGIVGRTEGKVSMTGNVNKAGGDVRLEVKSRNKDAETCSAGGIVGLSVASAGTTMSNNTNRATVTSECSGTQVMAGGIVGSVQGHLAMSDNINFGNVTMTGSEENIFAGGIVGAFNMHGSSGASTNANVSLLRDKSFGAISSSARAGLLFAAYGWNCYGNTTINDCVVGGSRQEGANAATVITADNFAANLWSYTRSGSVGTTLIQKNTTFGQASTYDTPSTETTAL